MRRGVFPGAAVGAVGGLGSGAQPVAIGNSAERRSASAISFSASASESRFSLRCGGLSPKLARDGSDEAIEVSCKLIGASHRRFGSR